MHRSLLLVVALTVAFAGAANAETVAQIFEAFGMLGTWAEHCKAPASDTNWYVEYSALPSGLVSRRHFKGAEPSFEYEISSAKISGDHISFSMSTVDPRHRGFGVELVKRGGRYKVWESANEYGHSQVIDGLAADTRVATNWQTKCR
jgi:hypothetical protein